MSTELATAPKPKNALMKLSERLSISPEKLTKTLKETVFKNCKTDEQFAVMVAVSNEYDLNPLTKQIYAFPGKGGGVEPIVSIDGWLKIINDRPSFDGLTVTMNEDFTEATCEIHVKGRAHSIKITEYLEECKRPTDPWKTMPKRMLRHKAIMQCGRVAFGICGIHDQDEAEDINKMRNVTNSSSSTNAGSILKSEPIELPPTISLQETDEAEQPEAHNTTEISTPPLSQPATDSPTPPTDVKESQEEEAAGSSTSKLKLFIGETEEASGGTGANSWTRYRVTLSNADGQSITATTFDTNLGKIAKQNAAEWMMAELKKVPEKGTQLLSLQSTKQPNLF